MPAHFSLDATDYKLLERAVSARFQSRYGRLNAAFLVQVFAWMFITVAVVTFFKLAEQFPEDARSNGVILLFAVLGFLFSAVRPLTGQWLYRRYVTASNGAFTAKQSVCFQDGSLVLESSTGKSIVPPSAIIDHSEDERNHYLFLTGVHAIIIPKNAAVTLGMDFIAYLAARTREA